MCGGTSSIHDDHYQVFKVNAGKGHHHRIGKDRHYSMRQ